MRKPAFGFFVEIETEKLSRIDMLRLKLCFANGVDAVWFSLNNLDFDNKTIDAFTWTKEGLKREVTQIPTLIEYGAGTKHRDFFRKNATIIDDFKLSKKDINDLLIKTEFANMVIPSLYTASAQKILNFTLLWQETIIKPFAGARGESIISIRSAPDSDYIFTYTSKETKTLNYQESVSLLSELYNNMTVIAQPRMSFKNKDGQTMDFRVNVSKNGSGKWETIFILPRTSRGSIVSNVASGGYASEIKPTLEVEYGENTEKVYSELRRIAEKIPPVVEEASHCNMLSLGIDVGIDFETLNPYIIEVNYVPQVHFKGELKYYYTQSEYIAYLAEKYGLK